MKNSALFLTTLLAAAIFFLTSNHVSASTTISGGIVSGTWNLAGSPYLVTGSIQIANSTTLTINPGVTVQFQGHYKLIVLGQLLAIGNATDSVYFTAASTVTGWYGIRFDQTASTNDSSKLEFCSIRWGNANGSAYDGYGGGIFIRDFSKLLISRCLIKDNTSTFGGGIYVNNSTVTISNNTISSNSAPGSNGGGIVCHGGGDAMIIGNIISNNTAGYGGGIDCYSGNPTIINNTITNNEASRGGGIASQNLSSNPVITNCTIANNSATSYGGGVYCDQNFSPTFTNTIFWGNVATTDGDQVFLNDEASDPNFYYCDVQGGTASFGVNGNIYSGTYSNNINSNPKFVSPSGTFGTGADGVNANWSEQSSSPCIDNGNPNGTYPSTDKAGNPRVTVCRIDIGAYEYQTGTPLTVSISQTQQILCYGDATAKAQATGAGGTGSYTYVWSNTQSAQTATGLATGIYTVTVSIVGGCTATNTISISQPTQVTYSNNYTTTLDCFGGNNGSAALVSVSGGTPSYTYHWSTNATTSSISNLAAANYSFSITDHNGCVLTNTFSIANPPAITYSVTHANVSCNAGSNGSITVNATGGTGILSYSKDNGSNYQSSNIFSGLNATTYSVIVRDANSCVTSSQSVTITEPTAVTFSVTQTNVSCHSGSNGSITISASGGTGAYVYYVGANSSLSNVFSSLQAGIYSVSVQDANNCTPTPQNITITEPNALAVSCTPANLLCFGQSNGSALANVTGGTSSYSYSWNTSPVQTTATASNLIAGSYIVTVMDAAACIATQTCSIFQPNNLTVSASGNVNPVCDKSGTAQAIAAGGTGAYTYFWSSGQTGTSITATGLSAGNYTVTVKDANACVSSANTFTITNNPPPAPSICVVSVDSLSKNNLIVWDKTAYAHSDTFLIYRDTANNNYGLIGKVPYDSLSMFADTVRTLYAADGNPNVTSWRYKLAVKDSCGNISAKSDFHQSIYIQNNSGNFIWNHYQIEGQPVPVPALQNYLFQRDNLSNGNYITIQTLSASSTSYTDPAYATYQNTATWRVKTLWNINCTPSLVNPKNPDINSINLNSSRSNVYRLNPTSANEISLNNLVSVSPNPTSGMFIIKLEDARGQGMNGNINIYNVMGEQVYSTAFNGHSTIINLDAPSGIYFLQLKTNEGSAVKKIIKE